MADVRSVLDDAIDYWAAAGFNTEVLNTIDVQVTDLRNDVLGIQSGNQITLDVDAAGFGWYVDADPATNEQFSGIDLYSTVVHELGHVLGMADSYDIADSGEVMYGYLQSGERTADLADQAIASIAAEVDFDQIIWRI